MPRVRKPKDQRQNRETRDIGAFAGAEETIEVPPAPPGLLPKTRASWTRFWTSPARPAVVSSLDLDMLERLWRRYDELARCELALRRPQRHPETGKAIRGTDSRVVEGSKGQLRPNGLYTVIARLDAEIRQLEQLTAKSMKSRLALGMVVGRDGSGADEPDESESSDRPPAEPDDAGDIPPDPRLYVLDGRAG